MGNVRPESIRKSTGVGHACSHSPFSLSQQMCTEHLLCARHPRDQNKNLHSCQTYILIGQGRQTRSVGKIHSMLNGDKCNVAKQVKERRLEN